MTRSISPSPLFFDPLTPDWTIDALLEWIGADDARCHDERLLPVLDAVSHALGSESRLPGRAVASVRLLASRVAADPTVGEQRLSAPFAVRTETGTADRVLLRV